MSVSYSMGKSASFFSDPSPLVLRAVPSGGSADEKPPQGGLCCVEIHTLPSLPSVGSQSRELGYLGTCLICCCHMPPALSSPHHSCLSLPFTVSHVLSLTPSGYFWLAPSHGLIYFHVRNMISESPVSFFLVPLWTGLNAGCQRILLHQLQGMD